MTSWNRVQGDIGDTVVVTLGGVADLTAVDTIVAHIKRGDTIEELDATVTSAVNRTVTVELGAADGWLATAAPGRWRIEYQATFLDGSVLTWPDDQPDTIIVRADQDPIVIPP
jgi:hypothetical protein